jgi:hypothetical protein
MVGKVWSYRCRPDRQMHADVTSMMTPKGFSILGSATVSQPARV